VKGLKLDFVALNLVGFTFYSIYTSEGYFGNFGNEYGLGQVTIQDLLFAYHALAIVIITCIQCLIYPWGESNVSIPTRILVVTYVITAILFYFLTQQSNVIASTSEFNWWLFLGYLKLSISTIKYTPQVYWNYLRKCTVGWSIFNIICDFTGGFFSVAQTVVDTYNGGGGDFNLVKFLLGNISIFFDIIFMIQHYYLYTENNAKEERENLRSMLSEDMENANRSLEDKPTGVKPNVKGILPGGR